LQINEKSMVDVVSDPVPNGMFDDRARMLGYIWALMLTRKASSERTFAILDQYFNPAFRHQTVRVLFNSLSEPVAYFVWAQLAEDVEQRILKEQAVRLHLSEWNEGKAVWILDAVVHPGYLGEATRKFILPEFGHLESIKYVKQTNSKFICKELDVCVLERLARL